MQKPSDDAIWLIDGSGYIFRAYYAIKRLSTSSGMATNAVYGFTNMLLKVLKDHQPKHLGIAFDKKEKTFRHDLYVDYKATRSAPPEDLPAQIPLIHRVVDAFRIPRLYARGYEADDVLGTMACRAKAAGRDVVIITADKDLMQLVDDRCQLLDEMRLQRGQDESWVDREAVVAKFGVPPERVVDVLALMGDTSDNVPGVKGIGEKTAAELVQQYGDVEAILAAAPTFKSASRRDKLLTQAEQARLSKQLVTICTDCQVDVDLEQLRYDGPDKVELRGIFEELEFKRLLSDPVVAQGDNIVVASDRGEQGDLFAAGLVETAPAPPEAHVLLDRSRYRAIVDQAGLDDVIAKVRAAKQVAIEVATDSPDAREASRARLLGVGLAWGEGEACYVPLAHHPELAPAQLPLDVVRAQLGPLLVDGKTRVVGQDAKYAANVLVCAGFPEARPTSDPMIATSLLNPDDDAPKLETIARGQLAIAMLSYDDVCGAGKARVAFERAPFDRATAYVAERADVALRLAGTLEPLVAQAGMHDLYTGVEVPLTTVLGRMERHGIAIDVEKLRSMSAAFHDEMGRLEKAAYAAAGREFNLGSPQQIATLLFDELKLPVLKRTAKRVPSTDVSVLEQLADKHEVPALILEHRMVSKLKNTYLDVLPTLVNKRTGRVHTTFNQIGAATGRLSSTDPNLQNIPIRTELGRKIRGAFVAEPGNVLVSLDYSQIELRLLAHASNDPVLVDTFRKHEDVHRRTAAEIFGVPQSEVTREQRNAAKTINFGLLYGMGVQRLARTIDVKRAEAEEYLRRYFERYAGIKTWQQEVLQKAHVDGEVRTLFGRRRRLPDLQSKNGGARARAERLAINTPIQGTAADLMKKAMIEADRRLAIEAPTARLLLQVHDELVLEVPERDVEGAKRAAKEAMEGAFALAVPLVVEGAHGRTWADAH